MGIGDNPPSYIPPGENEKIEIEIAPAEQLARQLIAAIKRGEVLPADTIDELRRTLDTVKTPENNIQAVEGKKEKLYKDLILQRASGRELEWLKQEEQRKVSESEKVRSDSVSLNELAEIMREKKVRVDEARRIAEASKNLPPLYEAQKINPANIELRPEAKEFCDRVLALAKDAEMITVLTKIDGDSRDWGTVALTYPENFDAEKQQNFTKRINDLIPEEIKALRIANPSSVAGHRDSGMMEIFQHPDDPNKRVLYMSVSVLKYDAAGRTVPYEYWGVVIPKDNPALSSMLECELHPREFFQALVEAGKVRYAAKTGNSLEMIDKQSRPDFSYQIADVADKKVVIYGKQPAKGKFDDMPTFVEALKKYCGCDTRVPGGAPMYVQRGIFEPHESSFRPEEVR